MLFWSRFAPTTLTADVAKLAPKDRQALDKIIAAAKLLDPLFLRQVWTGNDALEKKLLADKTPAGQQRLKYFYINDGPWSRLDSNEPFIEGVPREKPPQAAYYPDDMSKDDMAKNKKAKKLKKDKTKHDDMKKDDMKKDDMKHDDMGKDDMKKN